MSSRGKKDRIQCIGRVCGDTYYPIPGVSRFLRAREAQCDRACAEGSNLCKICLKHEAKAMEGVEGVWHGRIGQQIPEDSRIEGSAFATAQDLANAASLEARAAKGTRPRKTEKKAKVNAAIKSTAGNATGGVAPSYNADMGEFIAAMRKYAAGRAASDEKAAKAARRRTTAKRARKTTAKAKAVTQVRPETRRSSSSSVASFHRRRSGSGSTSRTASVASNGRATPISSEKQTPRILFPLPQPTTA